MITNRTKKQERRICWLIFTLRKRKNKYKNGFKKRNSKSRKEEKKIADEVYLEAMPNFQKAVQVFEGLSSPYVAETESEGEVSLKNKLSGLSLTNIAEIYIERLEPEVIFKQAGSNWLRVALKLYESFDKVDAGRTLTLVGLLLRAKDNNLHAEGLLRKALDLLKNVFCK